MSPCPAPIIPPIPANSEDTEAIIALTDIMIENNERAGICYIHAQAWLKWYTLNLQVTKGNNMDTPK